MDLMYVGLLIAFFAATAGMVWLCKMLGGAA